MDYMPVPGNSRLLDQFQKRYKAAQEVAYLWSSLHSACYFYAIPNRDKFWRPKEQQGEMRGARVYDTTAIEATKTFVSKLHTAMTPPQTQWGYMSVDEKWAAENPDMAKEAQQMIDDYMRRLFGFIHDSNFDVVINECYFDLAVGTSCLVINSYTDKNPLLFTSIPMDKLAVEEAMTGRLESWYRYWEDTKINEIKVRWPKARIPDEYLEDIKQDSSAVVRLIWEGVMYVPTEEKPYHYVVAYESGILYDEYFDINPGIVWRFQKTNNDIFGRGPIMDALPSIISLNELARIELAAANLNTFKPYMGFSDAVFNPHTFVMQPMTIIPIAPIGSSGGQVPLIPLPDSSAPQFSQLTIQDLRMQIRALLFAESPIPQQGSVQPSTATELMINQQRLAQQIGPLFSRLQQEFLFPLIERVAYILEKMGLLPKPKIKGAKITFQYRSPLALAKGQEQIARFTQYVQILQGISGPQMSQIYINSGEYPWLLAELMQLDPRFLNSVEKVKETSQNMQDQLEAQQQQGEEQQQGQAQALPAPGAQQ
jgi:hypothetical protein